MKQIYLKENEINIIVAALKKSKLQTSFINNREFYQNLIEKLEKADNIWRE